MAMVLATAMVVSFGELYEVTTDVMNKKVIYRNLLKDLKSMLDVLKPLIEDMARLNNVLDLPAKELEQFIDQFKMGAVLISKCANISMWNTYKKYKYFNQLVEFRNSLERQLFILQASHARDVRKTTIAMQRITNQITNDVQRITNDVGTGPIQAWCAVPELPRYLVGFDLPLRDLKSKLLNDDQISMLVLTGPGGCGKTTLATMLCRDAQVIDKFGDNIFFVTVSENPNLDLIINELYHRKGSTVPTFQNEATSVKWLHAFLKNIGTEPSLLVLDDVWSGSESLLDKFYEVKIQNVKIFVTSRSAFPGFGSSYNLGSLDNVQAMTLFHHSASLHNNSYHIPEDLVTKILDRCKGYPLAIKVVGRSLCGKPLEFWRKRETELSKGGSIVDFAPEALYCLRNSLDVLDEKEKEQIDENVMILKEKETNVMKEIVDEHNADLVEEKEKNVVVREEEIVMVVAGEESNVVKKKNGVLNEKNVVVRDEETVMVVAEEVRNVVKNKNDIRSWSTVCERPPVIVGLDVPLRDLKRMLLDDGISRLVLTAPGGAGKTTLATEFFQDEGIKGIFKNNMFFVVVSNKPSLELIVQELYRQKGGQPLPKYLDHEVIAVHWLEKFLEEAGQRPFLLVLDDVWFGSELLDKFRKFKSSNYKFLVTSRYEFRSFGKSYYLKTLDDEDAMILFRDAACLGNELSIPKCVEAEILKTCKGFPITIRVLGRSIRGQSIEDMQKTVMELSRGSILDSETEVLVCLQRSLDPLDKVTKECFMDLGAFPEDKITSATTLIDMWSELHGLDDEIMCVEILHKLSSQSLAKLDVTRYRCSSATILIDMWSELHGLDDQIMCVEILHKLSSRSLAKLDVTRKDTTEADGYYSEHFVTQHDVLRQLAIYQAKQEPIEQRTRLNITDTCGDNLPKWLIKQVHQPVKARLLSISSDGVFSTKWNTVRLPEVEVLLLNFEKIKNCLLPEFVEKLHELKVLIVTNYGPVPTVLSNFQLLGLLPSLKRIRLECISVPSITKNCPTQFRSLQKICFTRCDIGLAFSNMSIQISDAFPKLVEVSIEYCDLVTFPSELCDLVKLKKLSLIKCYKLSALPEEIGKLANLELLRLRSCIDLVTLPCSLQNLKSLNFLDIADCFSIKELPEHIGDMSSLRKINMVQCSGVEKLPLSVVNLEQLEEVICDGETSKLLEIYLDVLGEIIKLVPDL